MKVQQNLYAEPLKSTAEDKRNRKDGAEGCKGSSTPSSFTAEMPLLYPPSSAAWHPWRLPGPDL